jgi:hypothetical protein
MIVYPIFVIFNSYYANTLKSQTIEHRLFRKIEYQKGYTIIHC